MGPTLKSSRTTTNFQEQRYDRWQVNAGFSFHFDCHGCKNVKAEGKTTDLLIDLHAGQASRIIIKMDRI